jgi:hypothetical protein
MADLELDKVLLNVGPKLDLEIDPFSLPGALEREISLLV